MSQKIMNSYRLPHMPNLPETLLIAIAGLLLFVAGYWLFSTFPDLDMDVARKFYFGPEERFALRQEPMVWIARRFFLYATTIFYIAVGIISFVAWRNRKRYLRLEWHHWMFLLYCGLIGPVLISNITLKGNWDRARPQDVVEFGGAADFTPFWIWSDQCSANCSFISGEVSAVVTIFLSLAFLMRHRFWFYLASLVGGASIAVVRVVQGSHFLSDTVMALPIMIVIITLVYWLFYLGGDRFLSWVDRSPLLRT